MSIVYSDVLEVQDPTKTNCFMECPRKYFFEYVLHWRPEKPSVHLAFGAAFHLALEHLSQNNFSELSIGEAIDIFMEDYRRSFTEDQDALNTPKDPVRAALAIQKYAEEYRTDADRYEVLHTEVAGATLVTPEHLVHYKIDKVVRDRITGKIWVTEHKTGSAGASNRAWQQQWYNAFQPSTYYHAVCSNYGVEEVGGVIVDGIHFMRRQKDPIEFVRVELRKDYSQLQTYVNTAAYWLGEIKAQFELLRQCKPEDAVLVAFPFNTTNCSKWYGCPFLDFCLHWPNPLRSVDDIPLGYKREVWDPRSMMEGAKEKWGEEKKA